LSKEKLAKLDLSFLDQIPEKFIEEKRKPWINEVRFSDEKDLQKYIEQQIVNMLRILSKKEEIDTSNRNKKDLEYVEIDGIKINPHKLLLS
jgi:hypothetical protein